MIRRPVGLALLVVPLLVGAARAQGSLAEAAERVRQAWLGHDVAAVAGSGPNLVLHLPGADPSAPVSHAQAEELLRRHLRAGVERSLLVSAVRELEPGRGYAALERRYVVAGTTDERREQLFLEFRRIGREWVLTELRSAP
ncbi:MAG TPA: hypothetical protein VM716_14860 [Gemmatimonadales bacterium]|nr:hypothetical protein [Gemmatimonadales bacterium]